MKKQRTIEDIQRLIINHPVKAYMEIGVDFMGAINENSSVILTCVNCMAKSAVNFLKSLALLGRCTLTAIKHMIFLAFYPVVKLYYVMGARKELLREHPEYRQPRR